jgi:hypothetical protein
MQVYVLGIGQLLSAKAHKEGLKGELRKVVFDTFLSKKL